MFVHNMNYRDHICLPIHTHTQTSAHTHIHTHMYMLYTLSLSLALYVQQNQTALIMINKSSPLFDYVSLSARLLITGNYCDQIGEKGQNGP